jgi:SecD/SecF fusion protein
MQRPLFNRFFILAVLIALALYYVYPPSEKIKLGIDLQGGTSYTLELDLSKIEDSFLKKQAVDKAMEILRKRVDQFGVGEVIILPSGTNRIIVQIPGLDEKNKANARDQLQRVAYLEFRLVHPQNEQELARMKASNGAPPPGYKLAKMTERKSQSKLETEEDILVKVKPELNGTYLTRAVPRHDPGGFSVDFELNAAGGEIFSRVTRENIGTRLAVVLDGKVVSAPRINSEIHNRGQITGDFDRQQAVDLATALENPLDTPVKVLEERHVDPSLGADSVQKGFKAGIIALVAVAVFMAIYYLRAGMIANVALMVNIVLLFGVLTIYKFTLTLPGIAGIILTLGIAVDANVLIYERIREELRKGKSLVGAIDAGFDRAFGTIIDANVTTLITALVLVWLGTGPIQGFGLTLTAGIVTSVFSAVFVSRLVFDVLLRYTKFEKMPMLSFVKQTNYNFLSMEWAAYILSAAIIIAGTFMVVKNKEKVLGVDFTGGDALTLQFAQKVDVSQLRDALDKIDLKESFIQYQKEIQGAGEVLFIKVAVGEGDKAAQTIKSSFPSAQFIQKGQVDSVGGTIGQELKWTALKALLVSAVGILIYVTIRFEFAFAVGVVIALLHDVLICLACFFITDRQLSLTAIGALLTIAGYSLNDKIVVFDRIREELKLKGEKYGFKNLINLSVNETLGRTLLTSLTTFIASMSLYIFGGGVINDFAFILVVGVLTGPYSSVFIANSILLLWHPSELLSQAKPVEKDGERSSRKNAIESA